VKIKRSGRPGEEIIRMFWMGNVEKGGKNLKKKKRIIFLSLSELYK
jgi:hypothetical protein